jgi:hypothetical protein
MLAKVGPRSDAPAEVYPGRVAAQHPSRYAKWLAHAERRPPLLWHGCSGTACAFESGPTRNEGSPPEVTHRFGSKVKRL